MAEGGAVAVQRDPDPVSGLVVDLGAELLEHADHVLERDVVADGMGEDGVEDLPVLVVHAQALRGWIDDRL